MVTPASNTISRGAVFLSYAREDAEAARRIAEALRASGFEVWFDENELRGGDSWDVKIRKQIDACALFLPIISAHTQERSKGYFRLEWKLAVEQTHLLAEGVPFVAPVVIDDTKESGALVPPEFLRVQWTRLPGALPTPQFVEQVKRLLSKEQGARNQEMEAGTPRPAQRHEGVASPKKQSSAAPGWAWGVAAAALIAVGVGVATLRQPKPIASSSAPASATPANGTPSAPAVSAQSVAVLAFANLSDDRAASIFPTASARSCSMCWRKCRG